MKLDYNVIGVCIAFISKIIPGYVSSEVQKQITPGPRGFKGNAGLNGDRGDSGVKGDTGASGSTGEKGNPGTNGIDGQRGKSIIGPLGLKGDVGEIGKPGVFGKRGLKGAKGIEGNTGPQGERGIKGDTGPAPHHEWMGFKLRFQNPDGSWGKYTDLKGPRGNQGDGSGPLFDGFDHGNLFVIENNYLTSGNERIVCNAELTVTLNPSPFNDETVFVKRINGKVTIDGNGHRIDGEDTAIMSREFMTLRLTYAGDLQQWMIT